MFSNLEGQVSCWRRLLFCQKVGGQLPPPCLLHLRPCTILCKIYSDAEKPVYKHDCRIICIKYSTNDGRVKVISEILYCQYQIWELFESYMF